MYPAIILSGLQVLIVFLVKCIKSKVFLDDKYRINIYPILIKHSNGAKINITQPR